MIRLFKHYVPLPILLLVITEAVVLFSSMYAGTALRFMGGRYGDIELVGSLLPRALIFTLVMLGIMTAFGLHRRDAKQEGRWGNSVRFLVSFLVGLVVMLFIFYAIPDLFLGRGAFALVFLIAFVGAAVTRLMFTRVFKLEALSRRVLLLGSGSRSSKVELLERDEDGKRKFNLVGCLPLTNSEPAITKCRVFQYQGSILAVAKKHKVDEIVVGVRERRNGGLPADQLLECKLAGIDIVDLPSFFERETGQIQLESLNTSWMIFSDGFTRGTIKDIVKRMFDVTASALLLLITLPIMLITTMLIWLESGNPILYRQERVGERGRLFNVLKFRSMRVDAERDGVPRWAKQQDERITRVGRVIRKMRIDELPQVFNVLRGDMSFVGPRPERPYFVNELMTQIPYYASRHTVKPGITGWAQIRYPYCATTEDAIQKLQFDLYYVKNHSFFLDLVILLQTAQVILFGKGAR